MSSINCLITTVILIVTYIIFTLNYPEYKTIRNNCIINYENIFISSMNHIIFLGGNIYLLLFNNVSFNQLKNVYIQCVILQNIYLWLAIYIINNTNCTNYLHLTNYYSFINYAFWLSAYGLYLKIAITQLLS